MTNQTPFLIILVLLVSIFKNINCQLNSPCITPNGEEATCISARSCKVIVDALITGSKDAVAFAQQSHCGFDNRAALICCGSTAQHTLPDIFNIFTQAPPQVTISSRDQIVILNDHKTSELPDRTVCGLESEIDKISNGKITKIYEFPWLVALEYESKLGDSAGGIRCGGSIINNRYVLTAAHCLYDVEFKLTKAWLGDWRLSTNPDCLNFTVNRECNDPVTKLKIIRQIPHSYFSNGNNDIGLLQLEKDITFTKFIRPICLPPSNLPPPSLGTRLSIAGWGLINETGVFSDYKLKAEIPLTSNGDCSQLSLDRVVSANQFCAGGEGTKDSCQGDSGGPLMRKYEDRVNQQVQWYLEGIVSWGEGCGREGKPAVYTRVNRYINWIIREISSDDEET